MKNIIDTAKIEKKYIDMWYNSDLYKTIDEKVGEKHYVLVEFPYPSGSGLHVGHAFSFTAGDVYSRFKRMQGYNVLFPMGWDAFGLPTENYAIKMKRKPQEVTKENTNIFKAQMKRLGLSFDWDREVNTTDPEYYRWTQWIFIKLFEKGLAYKEEMPINWCPSCKIGLANEEVVNGNCERCGSETSRRNISQWIVKITDYADRLIDGLKDTNFIDKVNAAQINWIDRKEWIDITYKIEGTDQTVTVATTRPDTNFGATFIVLAPEHKLISDILAGRIKTAENTEKIREYVRKALSKSELDRQKEVTGRDKTGVFTGLYAINMLTGSKMPIWITDFVLGTVGTGAVVGVPAHDIRDFEFATQFKLPVIRVVVGSDGDTSEITSKDQVQEEEGVMINSGFLDGLDIHKAKDVIMEHLEKEGYGKKSIRYHLRDWIFSRQHYWGEPIPMVKCDDCGWVTIPETELPLTLPEVEQYEPTDNGESPLANITEWVNVKCPKCGKDAKRETDTMPNWAGSDWYYMRYLDPHNTKEIADMSKQQEWLPVDVYIGGDEHNTLHLLYSRFIYQFLYDLGYTATPEPYDMRISHGVILGPDNQRMSKSKGNVIVPDGIIDKVGADATRMYLMFIGPFDGTMAWNENSLMGVKRFINRVYDYIVNNVDGFSDKDDKDIYEAINALVKFAKEGYSKFQFNTIVAKSMEFMNLIEKRDPKSISKETIEKYIKVLAPIMPFITEDLWEKLGKDYSIHSQTWPTYDESAFIKDEIIVPVQINGRVKGKITVKVNASEQEVESITKADSIIGKQLEGKEIKKFIYIKGKIVNIVI